MMTLMMIIIAIYDAIQLMAATSPIIRLWSKEEEEDDQEGKGKTI